MSGPHVAFQDAGAYALERGIDALLATGDAARAAVAAFGSGALHYPDHAAIADALRPQLDASTTVLVKGSRFMRMERVVQAVQALAVTVAPEPNKDSSHAA